MVPWTAVNLVDYYLIRRGSYDVASFFAADGGVYGRYNMAALICYLLGILVQVPFIASDALHGSIARAMGGIDFSWIVGLLVVSAAYYFRPAHPFGGRARPGMMDKPILDLASLLHPVPLDVFFSNYWERNWLLVQRGDAGYTRDCSRIKIWRNSSPSRMRDTRRSCWLRTGRSTRRRRIARTSKWAG